MSDGTDVEDLPIHDLPAPLPSAAEPAIAEPEPRARTFVSHDPIVREASVLRGLLAAFQEVNEEAVMRLGGGEIWLGAVDAAQMAMLTAEMPGPKGDPYTLMVDVERVAEVIGDCKGAVILEHLDQGGDVLLLRNAGVSRTVGCPDGAIPTLKVPSLDFANSVQVDRDLVEAAVRHASRVSDHVALVIDEAFIIKAESDGRDEVKRRFSEREATVERPQVSCRSLFDIEWLQSALKAVPKGKHCILTLDLRTDFPLRMRWRHAGIDYTLLLAPRVESDPTSPAPSPPATETPTDEAAEDPKEADPEDVEQSPATAAASWDDGPVAPVPAGPRPAVNTMPTAEQADLAYKQGKSDKVYHAKLEPEGDGWVVKTQWGRRGATPSTKKTDPMPYAEAKRAFDKKVEEKIRDGYTTGESGMPFQDTDKAGRVTGILPQLLNPIDDPEPYLVDPDWVAQEKHTGNRVLVQKVGADVTGINRTGLSIPLPQSVADLVAGLPGDLVLDGELIGEDYHAFDLPGPSTLDERLTKLAGIWGNRPGLVHTAHSEADKRALLADVKERDAEGIVVKRRDAPYVPGRPNSGGPWLKLKLTESATVLVLGQNGAKNSVRIGVYDDGKLREIGNVTIPANHEIPKKGTLAEVGYLFANPGGALQEPTYLGPRTDVGEEACTAAQLKLKPVAA